MTTARQSQARTALAGLIGNVLEWFDFAVYGYFASDIGRQFFPQSSPQRAAAARASPYSRSASVARPIGSLVLGAVGDRIGRRALLTLSIALMGGATLLIGLLPTYEPIGVAAPMLLVLLRLVQGFSLGGEFTGSMVYTTELASPTWRGLVSSSTAAGVTLGFILGSALGVARERRCSIRSRWRRGAGASRSSRSVCCCVIGWLLRRGMHETAGRPAGRRATARRCCPRWSRTGCRSCRRSASSR